MPLQGTWYLKMEDTILQVGNSFYTLKPLSASESTSTQQSGTSIQHPRAQSFSSPDNQLCVAERSSLAAFMNSFPQSSLEPCWYPGPRFGENQQIPGSVTYLAFIIDPSLRASTDFLIRQSVEAVDNANNEKSSCGMTSTAGSTRRNS